MNRKHFINNMAGIASASLFTTSAFSNSVLTESEDEFGHSSILQSAPKITRGVSFYSYRFAFQARQMTLEEMIEEATDIGAGIEILPEWVIRDFPNVPESWVDYWWSLMEKYNATPVTYDFTSINYLRPGHLRTDEELVAELKAEIKLANRLGIKHMRATNVLNVLEECVPYAEENDVWMGIELHTPYDFESDRHKEVLESVMKMDSEHYGMLPDFKIFQSRPMPIQRNQQVQKGTVTNDIALYIEQAWSEKMEQKEVEEKVKSMKPKPGDLQYITQIYGIIPNNPRLLIPYMSKIKHAHAKFYDMTPDFQELSQPSEDIINAFKEGGFKGCLSSEFEGQGFYNDVLQLDECEQVRRHHVMLKRLIG